ncbi:hypothetical protein E1I69_17625 [Bacillus timonensis]|uniref:DUF3592 domain-containing protein n=1 Tax=Bacillus timonensis TaxID=1033734 RepID=A0A4S3PNE2_9BACI|nr:hypothetical protein [Bacillus timonensis]THE10764.1 hypothetical protein E1I69_17625 [Bacillus timonensis]
MNELNWPKLFAFAAFLFIIYTIFDNVQEHQVFLEKAEQNQIEERVWRKFVVNDLLVGPRFSVQIGTLPESSIPTKHNDSMITISQELFEQVDAGDTISGYEVDGKFYTETLLKEEVKWFYILLTVFSLYPIGYILYWLFKINIIWNLCSSISKRLYLDKMAGFVLSILIFGGLIVSLLLFVSTDTKSAIENGHEKYFGKNHAETTALIMEHGYDRRTSTYNRSDYYISMLYTPENQDTIFIVKGVTWHTYNKYKEKMPIVYNVDNPYQVYAKEMDIADYLDILMTETVFLTLLSVILIVLLSSIPFLLWKQKQRKSQKDHPV